MRVALFGSGGPFSQSVLDTLTTEHHVAAVIGADTRAGGALRRALRPVVRATGLRPDPFAKCARRWGAPYVAAKSRDDPRVAALLAEAAPDVVVIAKYPWILPMTVFQTSRLGAINLHPALLPRHRGPLPLFWIYHGDDRESGVTAHWVTAEVDAGPIAGRTKIPVPRGLPVDDLSRRNGEIAGPLALAVLADIDSGTAAAEQQDDDLATAAPYLSSGRPMVDFEAWPVERVWHFLAGLFPRFQEPLRDQGNRPARYYGVTGYTEAGHSKALGRVERQGQEWSLGCRGGFVRLRATRGPRAIE